MKKKSVSIVVPNYNGIDYLKKNLDSICSQTIAFDEIIVIDDASTDNSVCFIKKNYPCVKVIENKHNVGFAKSVNRGISAIKSRYVCLLNNDLYLSSDWLEKAMEPFGTENNIAAAATNILIAGNSYFVDSQGDDYFIIGTALKHNHLKKNSWKNNHIKRVFSACAAAVVYDKELLDKIGLFDEFLQAYYEDVDLSFRINLSGYKIFYTPYAVSYHCVSASYGINKRKILFYSYRNEEIIFWSDMPSLLLCGYFSVRIIFLIMQLVVKLFRGEAIVYLQAKTAFLLAVPYVIKKRIRTQKLKKCPAREINNLLRQDWIKKFLIDRFCGFF